MEAITVYVVFYEIEASGSVDETGLVWEPTYLTYLTSHSQRLFDPRLPNAVRRLSISEVGYSSELRRLFPTTKHRRKLIAYVLASDRAVWVVSLGGR